MTRSRLSFVAAGTALVLACAAPARAQSAAPAEAPMPQENPAKIQAFRFEAMLRNAIELAGQRLAQQARKIAPDLTLHVAEPAVARGVRLQSYGFYFDVQAPNITSSMMVWGMMRGPRPLPANPVTPVRNGGAEAPLASPGAPVANFDPDQAYTTFVREAMIDSILDESNMLLLGPNEFLTVAVSGVEQPIPNTLYRASAVRLLLTIRASDLTEFRQGRLTREDVKRRIEQDRF